VRPEPDAFVSVPVPGGELAVARWGRGHVPVLAAHGITASSMSWRAVARHLDDASMTLWAPDLRGRGASAGVGGPFGLERHAHDLLAVADHLGLDRVVLAGHSLGAFVAVLAAVARPEQVERVVLVDGGLPLQLAVEGVDPDAVLDAALGPAIQRLDQTYPSFAAYEAFWRQHPAFAQNWSHDIEAFVRYDVTETADGGLRSRVVADAVRSDGRDLLLGREPIGRALDAIRCPVHLLRAPRGMFDEPPVLQPDELVAHWATRIADLSDDVVHDTNHYTILMGGRGASAVADALAHAPWDRRQASS
jgi:pimeloyl-ACP methyl ester carboxylesterase